MAVSRDEFAKFLSGLSAQERYEMGLGGTAPAQSTTPKLSPVLDQVADGDVDAIVAACRRGIEKAAADGGSDHDALAELEAVNPRLAAAARANSHYRGKPYTHSLRTIADYLQSPEAAARRSSAAPR